MDFKTFQATGHDVADIAIVDHIRDSGGSGPGRLYLDDDLFIERSNTGWILTLGNEQSLARNLASLERRLYDWAVAEGYVEE